MKQQIVFDGAKRLQRSPEFQARLEQLRETVRARHAAGLAQAGWFGRLVLRWQMAVEYLRERRKLRPSARSLYSQRPAT